MKPFVFAVLFIAAQAVQFEVKDKNDTVCILLQLDGVLNIEALHNGTVEGKTSLNFTNAAMDNQSDCTTIILNLEKKAEVWFQFKEDGNVTSVIPQAKFDSKTALSLNETETVDATAEALTFPKDKSFLCKSSVDHAFKINNGTFKYTYNVDAVISNFQIQSGDIKNSSFGPSQDCQEDTPTTPATTAATSTAVTTAATTTPVPNEDIFGCVIGNVTKFLFKANMSLAITYEAKEGNATVNTTAYIDVPLFTRNDTSCENPLEEVLNIHFLNNWTLEFVFQREKNTSSDFYVSHITLNYTTASLKNAVKNETLFANYTASDNTFLKSSGGSYYVCRANSSIDLNKNAKLSTSQLYYRAFNDKGDIQFTGDATECSADEETSSVVPIAVGAALAGLVVIVLIAYLIGRRRSRKAGYESV